MKLAIDLFCGLGGWTEGLLANGYTVIGFDIERHDYGTGGYPGQLVIQDVLTLHGSQFKNASLIVASPPCQKYSYMAMPWSKAKEMIRYYQASKERQSELNALFNACFRIQREASEAAGHHIPMIVENVRGAQRWVGRSQWNFGSYHLWGDVPALMPMTLRAQKSAANSCKRLPGANGGRISGWPHDNGNKGKGSWFGDYQQQKAANESVKQGGDWFGKDCQTSISRMCGSKSQLRKRASAEIAKIPFALSSYIGSVYA